jgi:Flp pilus assembly protein TadG
MKHQSKSHNRGLRHRSSRQGAVLVLACISLIAVVAFLAFSIDFGYTVLTESELQNAADSAALSGALALAQGREFAAPAATAWAAKNVAAGEPVQIQEADVEIGIWDEDTASLTVLDPNSEESPNAVRVTCRRTKNTGNPLKLFIAPILGTESFDLTVSATARLKSSRCGLFIGLEAVTMSGSSHTDSYRSNDGPYNSLGARDQGHVCTNGNIKMSGSTAIRGNGHPGPEGSVDSSSSVGVLGSTDPLPEPISFPPVDPGDASSVNDNGSIPMSDEGIAPLNGGEFKLSGGDGVDLPPGTYYFSKMTLSGGSAIRISGATVIYVSGECSLSGGSVTNLTALPKNLQLNVMGSKCVISGGSEFYGIVYAPTAKVERSGDSDYFGSIVGRELVLSGSGGLHGDESLDADSSGQLRTTLVE